MRPQVVFLDASGDVGTPIYDAIQRAHHRRRRFELALLPLAAIASLVVLGYTFWIGVK